MFPFIPFSFRNNTLLLTPGRSIFWEEKKLLILSDLHLGKSGHFRKSGIAVPQKVFREDLQRLFDQVRFFNPKELLIVGDLFHSTDNKEHELFLKWRKDMPITPIRLIRGNHDILPGEWYAEAGIELVENELVIDEFVFTHDISSASSSNGHYYFSGHIHPGIVLNGMGKQSIRLPCFYFGKQFAVLPAFGKFTGTHAMDPGKGDHVFAILEKEVIKVR